MYVFSLNFAIYLREAQKKSYFLNGRAIKALPSLPPNLMTVGTFFCLKIDFENLFLFHNFWT